MKQKHKIYYSVDFIPTPMGVKISNLMAKFDLGVEKIFITREFSWDTTTRITKKYIEKMKKVLAKAIESVGGEVIEIRYKYHN